MESDIASRREQLANEAFGIMEEKRLLCEQENRIAVDMQANQKKVNGILLRIYFVHALFLNRPKNCF